jgi:hypothetical protein
MLDCGEYIIWFYRLADRLVLRRLSVPYASETLVKQHGVDAFIQLPGVLHHFLVQYRKSTLYVIPVNGISLLRWYSFHTEKSNNFVLTRYCVGFIPELEKMV